MPQVRRQFWFETTAGAASGVLLLVTLLAKDWIELIFRVDPDHHGGSFELLLVGASLAVTVTSFALARAEWLRATCASAEAR